MGREAATRTVQAERNHEQRQESMANSGRVLRVVNSSILPKFSRELKLEN